MLHLPEEVEWDNLCKLRESAFHNCRAQEAALRGLLRAAERADNLLQGSRARGSEDTRGLRGHWRSVYTRTPI